MSLQQLGNQVRIASERRVLECQRGGPVDLEVPSGANVQRVEGIQVLSGELG